MKAKNIISLLLVLIITGLFTSCNYTKNEKINTKTKTNTKEQNVSKNTNVEKKSSSTSIKIGTGSIGDTNISPVGGGSVKGGVDTGENPLDL